MTKLNLNTDQILELMNNKRIFIASNKIIEFYDDDIILNIKGKIRFLKSVNLEFSQSITPRNFLHPLICDYFNCAPYEVICTGMSNQEATFRIRLSAQKELGIVVVTASMAKIITKSLIDDEDIDDKISKNQIGLYHRLGDTDYYFRWDDEII